MVWFLGTKFIVERIDLNWESECTIVSMIASADHMYGELLALGVYWIQSSICYFIT